MLLHKLLWLQVQNLVVSRVKVECLLANELIVDPGVLEQKLARIRMVGLERFFVVADWDRTLTRAQTVDGEDTTSYLAVVQGGYLGEGYREEMDRLYREYRPIEVSQTASSEQKTEAMHNWWTAAFELMRTYGLTEVMVEDVARRDLMRLRDGAVDFFAQLVDREIPLMILSAGIGNVIAGFLRAGDLLTSNVCVVANVLKFDEGGMVDGFAEPVIHSLNKRVEIHCAGVDTLGCCLLLGDTLEDAQMVDGVDCEAVIRIGYLNEDVDKNCDAYLNVYDVLICEDGDMKSVNQLLGGILAG